MIPKSFVLALLTLLVTAPLVAADGPPAAPARVSLAIGGEVAHPLRLSAEDLGRLPRLTVHAKDHDGKDVEYSGVSLTEVLKLAAIPTGEDIKGPWLAKYLLVSAADGYRAVFALPELSPSFTNALVLLADQRDGKPLSAAEGPLRLVLPGEKRQARWVRQVLSLTLKSAPQDDTTKP
jgi:DMSO/TMAO reductase YedYZ molybdopterin-dependent catalytic subunit